MGRPVRICSSPSRSIISVPDAGRFHRTGRPTAFSKGSMTSGGNPSGYVGNGREDDARHLPVARRRIFSRRTFGQAPESPFGDGGAPPRGWRRGARGRGLPNGAPGSRRPRRRVGDGVGSLIAVPMGVGKGADADPVQHDEGDPLHRPEGVLLRGFIVQNGDQPLCRIV